MNFARKNALQGGLVLLLLHFAWLYAHFEPALFSPDAHGYLLQTRLLADQGRTWFTPESALQHTGMHWYEAEQGRYYSHYPFGMPLLAVPLYWLGGPEAVFLVNLLLASLTLIGFFLLGRHWLGDGWALLATAVMALNPQFNEHALNKDAHLAVACFLIWGLYLLLCWSRSRSPLLAFFTGAVWGFLPLIRYPAVLYGLIVPLFACFHHRSERRTRISYLTAALGALLPIGILLYHNRIAFGAFYRTGYSLTNEQTAFALSHFLQHFLPYMRGLLTDGAGLFFPLGVAGIAALAARRPTRWIGVLAAVALIPITGLYIAYYWGGAGPGGGGGGMRFLIPTFFLYTLAAVALIRELTAQWPGIGNTAVAALFAVHLLWAVGDDLQILRRAEQSGIRQTAIAAWIADRVEPGSLVIAQSMVQQQLDIQGKWRLVDETLLNSRRGARPRFARNDREETPTGPFVGQRQREQSYGGLSGRKRLERITGDLVSWAGGERSIYWIMAEDQLRTQRRSLDGFAELAVVDSLELPQEDTFRRRFGRANRIAGNPLRQGRMEQPADFPQQGEGVADGPPGGMGFAPMGGAFPPPGGRLLLVEWRPLASR